MTPVVAASGPLDAPRPVFAGTDVCREAGFTLPEGARRAMFDDDQWDFTEVAGLPVQMPLHLRRLDFTAITDPRWRQVAKELILALLAPRHQAVAVLPRALRSPLHLTTASGRLAELTRFLNWLTAQGVGQLGEVDTGHCEHYLAFRRYVRDEDDVVVGELGPATRRAAAQTIVDLVSYRQLFTADRVAAGLRPWAGASPSAIAEMPSGRTQNKTPPVGDAVLQPLLAAAGYLVATLGVHAVELSGQVRAADQAWSVGSGRHADLSRVPETQITQLLADHERTGEPLPTLPDHNIRARLAAGWSPDDPLTAINLGLLARQAGITRFHRRWIPLLRAQIEATLRSVGAQKPFGRDAVPLDRADGEGSVAWTLALDRIQAVGLIGIVRTACIIVIAAASGMRSSELMELQIGCCRPPENFGSGQVRYRLASRVVKGQPLGGVADEWVVVEPVYRAAELLEQLHDSAQAGTPLLGRFAFQVRYRWFERWVNGPAGQRLGLAPIPEGKVTLRMLRRTLALELAYRPGGAQAELLAEINKHEADRNLGLLWTEFRNYQQGVMPAGPGARELIDLFAHIDTQLDPADAGAPKVQRNNREMLNLLSKRADTLHLGAANYCWFTDPSRALCLELAGAGHADKPLAGMCNSARCPHATHHPCHRPVWAEHAETTQALLAELGPTRRTDKARLQAEHDRATRVLADIDAADPAAQEG